MMKPGEETSNSEKATKDIQLVRNTREYEQVLNESLQLFEFSRPLQSKEKNSWRFFYNNCNGLEANTMISTYVKQKKEKKQ